MEWNTDRTYLTNWGAEPTLIEPVTGTVTLTGLERARSLRVTAPGGKPSAARKTAHGWEIQLGATVTPWVSLRLSPQLVGERHLELRLHPHEGLTSRSSLHLGWIVGNFA